MKKGDYVTVELSKFEKIMRSMVQHYDEKKYWKRRNIVVDPKSRKNKLLKLYYLYYIKKCDAFNNATFATHMGYGAKFKSVPKLPHGLYGIVISHGVSIGKNVTIFHQVTIGDGNDGAPEIGDNVVVGAGAKILGNIKIGNNVLIGAGAIVTEDVPDNSIVRAAKGTIFEKNSK